MNVFCDTNIFIAAFLESHEHHASAWPIIDRVKRGADRGCLAAHSLAEIFAVLTRLRAASHISPTIAWRLIDENILGDFKLVALTSAEYRKALRRFAAAGIEGGQTYDALVLAAAAKSNAERIYTFDVRHFQGLAAEALRGRIVRP
jgi:predicted nucleic acid-binding protein